MCPVNPSDLKCREFFSHFTIKLNNKNYLDSGMSVFGQVQIQDFVRGGGQLLRPKVAHVTKWSSASGASHLWLGSRTYLRALEAFGFLMLKYAYETLFLLFLTASSTPKTDKDSTLHYASINFSIFMSLHILKFTFFYIFMKKLAFDCLT